MEGIQRGENFESSIVMAELAGQFVESLVGLGAAVAKKDASRARVTIDALGEPPLGFVVIEIGDMEQPP